MTGQGGEGETQLVNTGSDRKMTVGFVEMKKKSEGKEEIEYDSEREA